MHDTFHPLFVDYCSYFNGNEDFFECHEVLEELWKQEAPGDKQHPLVGLIQVATSLYHWRRGNFRGATKSMSSAISILQICKPSCYLDSIDVVKLLADCNNALSNMMDNKTYKHFSLSISDQFLLIATTAKIAQLPEMDPHYIKNKHTLRDRSEVILAREAKLNAK